MEVINFVADYTGTKPSQITPGTLINEELGIDGDDGSEVLLGFSKILKLILRQSMKHILAQKVFL